MRLTLTYAGGVDAVINRPWLLFRGLLWALLYRETGWQCGNVRVNHWFPQSSGSQNFRFSTDSNLFPVGRELLNGECFETEDGDLPPNCSDRGNWTKENGW